MKKSNLLDFLFGYESSEEKFRKSGISRAGKTFSDKLISGVGSTYAKKLLESPVAKFFERLTSILSHIYVRSYGVILMSFAIVTLLMNFASYYFSEAAEIPVSDLIIGAVCFVISIPLLLTDKPLAYAVSSGGGLVTVIFDALCLKRYKSDAVNEKILTLPAAAFIGIVPAVIGFFVPIWTVFAVVGGLIYLILAMYSPEFSFMFTILTLPALPLLPHSGIILASLVMLTVVSFLLKVTLGKRLLHFEQYDLILILLFVFILISGIFNKGFNSFESALLMIALAFGYFLASNIIVNRRLADNAINLLLFSSVPVAIYGIITYIISPSGLTHPEWVDPSFAESIASRAYSTFGNPNIYAIFLIVAIIFSLTFALDKNRGWSRILYFAVFLINLALMIMTWTRGAWVALLLSIPAYLILHFKKVPKLLLIPLGIIPLLVFALPEAFLERILSVFNLADTSISTRLSIWRSSLSMFGENIFIGAGVGAEAYGEEFLKYAEDGVTAIHSHNLFLEIGCQCGIFALILFVFILLVRIRHIATYKPYIKKSSITSPVTMTGIAIFALVCFGMTDYIWYSSSMYYLFWLVFGLGSATLRIAKKEYEENLEYAGMDGSAYSAVADIPIADWEKSE